MSGYPPPPPPPPRGPPPPYQQQQQQQKQQQYPPPQGAYGAPQQQPQASGQWQQPPPQQQQQSWQQQQPAQGQQQQQYSLNAGMQGLNIGGGQQQPQPPQQQAWQQPPQQSQSWQQPSTLQQRPSWEQQQAALQQRSSWDQQQPPPPQQQQQPPAAAAPFQYQYAASALQPPPAAASHHEPYGQVATPGGLTHRSDSKRHHVPPPAPTPYTGAGGGGSYAAGAAANVYGGAAHMSLSSSSHHRQHLHLPYQHNAAALCFLIPALMALFGMFADSTPYPMQVFFFVTLCLYAMDLANARDMIAVCIWLFVAVLTLVTGWFLLLSVPDDTDEGLETLTLILRIAGHCFLFLCLGAWCTLQFQWLYAEAPSWAKSVERMLHGVLPPAAAAIVALQLSNLLIDEVGVDMAAISMPLVFALLMTAGMLLLGCCESSFVPPPPPTNNNNKSDHDDNGKSHHIQATTTFVLPSRYARIHSAILLLVPALIHVMTFRRRLLSVYVSTEEWYDLILVWAIPYLLLYAVHVVHHAGKWTGPYVIARSSFVTNLLFPRAGNTLRGTFVPLMVSLAASLAAQQRYLIPICQRVSYQFQGHEVATSQTVMIFLTVATLFMVAGSWVWGSYSTTTNEPLFGDFHEDVVQLCYATAGVCAGRAFGMPWGLVPLPILAFLGLSLWLTTRLLRYLAVFLFVLHATGIVLFSYRFAGMENLINLPIPGLKVNLTRFGILIVAASVLIGFLAGLAIRSTGGVGTQTLKRLDVAGILLVVYCFILTALECTLLTQPLPAKELAGIELDLSDLEDDEMLYDQTYAYMTSGLIVGIALFMQHHKGISSLPAAIAISAAVGKAMAVFIEANEESTTREIFDGSESYDMLFRSLSGTLLFVVMFIPRAILRPIHVKSKYASRRSHVGPGANGTSSFVESLPLSARPMIMLYTLIMLPACLLVSVPTVIMPMIGACANYYGGGYYDVSPPLSMVLGYILALWGLSCLSMLNHYLPDGGGEAMKQLSALTFLMAIGLVFAAPTLPDWLVIGMKAVGAGKSPTELLASSFNNPYATVSSIGVKMIRGKRSGSGGWGLLSASFATLLAVSGPLELRERKHTSGRKDKFFLVRLMTFSIMFGCGVAWFIVMQNMSEENFLVLILTGASCMAVAFFGTVATVLGYFLEIENFDEAVQVAYVWVAAFPLFMIICALPQFLIKGEIHPFGIGGWLSTYLSIYGLVALAFSLALCARPIRNKDTRATGNSSCVISFICAVSVLYGRFGVAGLDSDFDVATLFGVPASTIGTFFVAPVLLLLEGESSGDGRGSRIKKLQGGPPKGKTRVFGGLTIKELNASTKFVPPLMGTVVVFLYASLYAILLRGSGLLVLGTVAKSHEEVYKTAMATGSKKLDDLAALFEKTKINNRAMFASAQLAGAGFWTSTDLFGPLLHLGGVVACLPSLYFMSRYMWSGTKVSAAAVTFVLPLNVIPLVLCKGIPTLRAAALVGIVGSLLQLLSMRAADRKSKMRI